MGGGKGYDLPDMEIWHGYIACIETNRLEDGFGKGVSRCDERQACVWPAETLAA